MVPESEGDRRGPAPALVPPSAYPMRERSPVAVPVPSPLRAAMRPLPLALAKILQRWGRVCPQPSPSLGCPFYLFYTRFTRFLLRYDEFETGGELRDGKGAQIKMGKDSEPLRSGKGRALRLSPTIKKKFTRKGGKEFAQKQNT